MRRDLALRLAATALLLAALAGARPAAAAETDYCALGSATSLLLVDRSTRYDEVDRDILVRTVDSFFRQQEPGERLVVAAAGGAYTELKLVFDACRPGCPEAGLFGRLTSACRPVLARADFQAFEAEFLARLVALLKQPEEAAASDLFRSVAEATRLVEANRYAPVRQLLMFSDLLEASSLLPGQAIRRMPAAEVLQRLAEARVEARLPRAEVRVIGFGRSDAPGRPPLPQDIRRRVQASWESWFRAGGAGSVQIGLR